MTRIVSFSGVSNSGKTTLIEGLCRLLTARFRVGVIKHDPGGKAVFDTSGKDSFRFFESGAEVAVISPKETTLRCKGSLTHEEILGAWNAHAPLDYLFIEGFKTMPYRQICVVRGDFVAEDVKRAAAIATLEEFRAQFADKTLLNLNDHGEVLKWINSEW